MNRGEIDDARPTSRSHHDMPTRYHAITPSRLQISRAIAAFLLVTIAGCNIVGAVAYKVAGPPKVPAKFTPPMQPMVVLVERYGAPSSSLTDCETLAREIYRELSRNNVAQQIDPITITTLRDKNPTAFRAMTVSQIGAAVTAKQVLYVNLTSFTMDSADGGVMFRGSMAARVKVIDVATGATTWPEDATDGYPISGEVKPTIASKSATPEAARVTLIRKMAFSTARLFYEWTPEDEIPDD